MYKEQSNSYNLTLFTEQSKKHEIPTLEVMGKMLNLLKGKAFLSSLHEKVIFVGVQHTLETTATLYQTLIKVGADPKKMYFTGKCFSTNYTAAQSVISLDIVLVKDIPPVGVGRYQEACRKQLRILWSMVEQDLQTKHKNVDTIIIVDDGGRCFEEMPKHLRFKYKIAGLEQTRGGLYSKTLNLLPCSIVNVAFCAAKKKIESMQIAQAVFRRIDDLKLNDNSVCGVIGNGDIGNVITNYLTNTLQAEVLVYDNDTQFFDSSKQYKKFYRLPNIEAIITNADYIFGCTGKDITEGINVLDLCKGQKKVFTSCSSEDKEFRDFLLSIADKIDKKTNPLDDIKFTHNNCKVQIINGGFPVNFDRKPWNVPAKDIELTQCLMFGGIIQTFLSAKKPIKDGFTINDTKKVMLDPYLQSWIVKTWAQLSYNQKKYQEELLNKFKYPKWIENNSQGIFEETALSKIFEAPENNKQLDNNCINFGK